MKNTKLKKVKVFRLNEYEWWAGYSLKEIKRYYLKETGVDEEEAFDEPCELSEQELKTFKFRKDNGIILSFRKELDNAIKEGQEFPCFFATTES